ncbi:hypothetical protein M569_02561, partial [Genlisea aurea]
FSAGCLEIRLFYVRIVPCAMDNLPEHLILRHLRREPGVLFDINGARIPSSDEASITLRRDRVDRDSSEATYVTTDSLKLSGPVEFEVCEDSNLFLCGSLENDLRTGWSMDCFVANGVTANGPSKFFQPRLGLSSPSVEVYIAGCCSGSPVILTKTISVTPRKKLSRQGMLDAIPEDEEVGKDRRNSPNGAVIRQRKSTDSEGNNNKALDSHHPYYSGEEMYYYSGEDGQLTWFNAGVRVGVGIGLGMCLGVGIGVGLLLRSYQATTRSFRRRFF